MVLDLVLLGWSMLSTISRRTGRVSPFWLIGVVNITMQYRLWLLVLLIELFPTQCITLQIRVEIIWVRYQVLQR